MDKTSGASDAPNSEYPALNSEGRGARQIKSEVLHRKEYGQAREAKPKWLKKGLKAGAVLNDFGSRTDAAREGRPARTHRNTDKARSNLHFWRL